MTTPEHPATPAPVAADTLTEFRDVAEMLVADWEHEGDSAIGESVYLKAKAALSDGSIGPAGCDMEKRWATPFDDIEDEQIRSLWQTTDTGDIEDDILSFARSLLALAAQGGRNV